MKKAAFTMDADAAAQFVRKKMNEAALSLEMIEKIALEAGEDELAEKISYAIAAISDAESHI